MEALFESPFKELDVDFAGGVALIEIIPWLILAFGAQAMWEPASETQNKKQPPKVS